MSSTCGKKKSQDGGTFTICPAVVAKWGKDNTNVCKIKLFEYDHDETWNEVLNDLLDWQNLHMHKTDNHDLFI